MWVLLAVAGTVAAAELPPRHAKYPKWVTSYEAARTIARKEDRPMLVVLRCEP